MYLLFKYTLVKYWLPYEIKSGVYMYPFEKLFSIIYF